MGKRIAAIAIVLIIALSSCDPEWPEPNGPHRDTYPTVTNPAEG